MRNNSSEFDWFESSALDSIQPRVLIVEDDFVKLELLKKLLVDHQPCIVDTASTVDEAWTLIQEIGYQSIIIDWSVAKSAGVTIFNRLRNKPAYEITPILIVADKLESEDVRLFDEYPCTRWLTKSLGKSEIATAMNGLIQEHTELVHIWDDLNGAVNLLESDHKSAVSRLLDIVAKNSDSVPTVVKVARALVGVNDFETATKLLIALSQTHPKNVLAVFELGKIHYLNKDYDAAAKTLAKAQNLSPKNISRARILGEVEVSRGNLDEAQKHFESAIAIDANDAKAKQGVELVIEAKKQADEGGVGRVGFSLASMLNLMGINLSRQDKFDQAAEKYREALEFLSDPITRGKILYNLGLTIRRSGDTEKAAETFRMADKLSGGQLPKLRAILGANVELPLTPGDAPAAGPTPARVDMIPNQSTFQIPMPDALPDIQSITAEVDKLMSSRDQELAKANSSVTEFGKMVVLAYHDDPAILNRYKMQVDPLNVGVLKTTSDADQFLTWFEFYQPKTIVLFATEKSKAAIHLMLEDIYACSYIHAFSVILYTDSESIKAMFSRFSPSFNVAVFRVTEWKRTSIANDLKSASTAMSDSLASAVANFRKLYLSGELQKEESLAAKKALDSKRSETSQEVIHAWKCLEIEYLIALNRLDDAKTELSRG